MVYNLFSVLCPQRGVRGILSEHHLGEEGYDHYHAPWHRLLRARFHSVAKTDWRDRIMDGDSCGRTAHALDYHCNGDWNKKIKFPSLIKSISSVRLKAYTEVEVIVSKEKSALLKE